MNKGMSALALCVTLAAGAQAATVSLRPSGDVGEDSLVLVPGGTGSFDVVLELAAGERADFVNVFLDAEVVPDVEGTVIEIYDLTPGFESTTATYVRTEAPLNVPLPRPEGEGIDVGEYFLLLQDADLTGPGTFVLEHVLVRGRNLGDATISFELGERPPDIFDGDNIVPTAVGGQPLLIEVNETITVDPGDNMNDNGGPGPAPMRACGAGTCGAGASAALTLGVIGLATIGARRRRAW